jgi:hypothetical protein
MNDGPQTYFPRPRPKYIMGGQAGRRAGRRAGGQKSSRSLATCAIDQRFRATDGSKCAKKSDSQKKGPAKEALGNQLGLHGGLGYIQSSGVGAWRKRSPHLPSSRFWPDYIEWVGVVSCAVVKCFHFFKKPPPPPFGYPPQMRNNWPETDEIKIILQL